MKLNRVETLLDLGGGPGTYAMAVLARHPKLKPTICDRPAALEVAKEIAARHKARKRLSYLSVDFMDEDLPDIMIWYGVPMCSTFIHPTKTKHCFGGSFRCFLPVGSLSFRMHFFTIESASIPKKRVFLP